VGDGEILENSTFNFLTFNRRVGVLMWLNDVTASNI
jgi:hypothetical protein